MTTNEIIENIKADFKIDKSNLSDELARIPDLHIKYLEGLKIKRNLLVLKEFEYNKTLKDRTEYYRGHADPEVYKANPLKKTILKQDIDLYLNCDEILVKKSLEVHALKQQVDILEKTMKTLDSRGYNINAMINWLNFEYGNGNKRKT